jgi:hypothetical protein
MCRDLRHSGQILPVAWLFETFDHEVQLPGVLQKGERVFRLITLVCVEPDPRPRDPAGHGFQDLPVLAAGFANFDFEDPKTFRPVSFGKVRQVPGLPDRQRDVGHEPARLPARPEERVQRNFLGPCKGIKDGAFDPGPRNRPEPEFHDKPFQFFRSNGPPNNRGCCFFDLLQDVRLVFGRHGVQGGGLADSRKTPAPDLHLDFHQHGPRVGHDRGRNHEWLEERHRQGGEVEIEDFHRGENASRRGAAEQNHDRIGTPTPIFPAPVVQ